MFTCAEVARENSPKSKKPFLSSSKSLKTFEANLSKSELGRNFVANLINSSLDIIPKNGDIFLIFWLCKMFLASSRSSHYLQDIATVYLQDILHRKWRVLLLFPLRSLPASSARFSFASGISLDVSGID